MAIRRRAKPRCGRLLSALPGGPEGLGPAPGDGEDEVDGRLEAKLPVALARPPADLGDAVDVDGQRRETVSTPLVEGPGGSARSCRHSAQGASGRPAGRAVGGVKDGEGRILAMQIEKV